MKHQNIFQNICRIPNLDRYLAIPARKLVVLDVANRTTEKQQELDLEPRDAVSST